MPVTSISDVVVHLDGLQTWHKCCEGVCNALSDALKYEHAFAMQQMLFYRMPIAPTAHVPRKLQNPKIGPGKYHLVKHSNGVSLMSMFGHKTTAAATSDKYRLIVPGMHDHVTTHGQQDAPTLRIDRTLLCVHYADIQQTVIRIIGFISLDLRGEIETMHCLADVAEVLTQVSFSAKASSGVTRNISVEPAFVEKVPTAQDISLYLTTLREIKKARSLITQLPRFDVVATLLNVLILSDCAGIDKALKEACASICPTGSSTQSAVATSFQKLPAAQQALNLQLAQQLVSQVLS